MAGADTYLGVSIAGLAVGGIAAYLLKGSFAPAPEPEPQPEPVPLPQPIPTPGFTYFYKNKSMCRDAHINLIWLSQQGIAILKFQLWNDGRYYVAVCGTRSPLYFLVALDKNDALSRIRLLNLGFTEYIPTTAVVGDNIPYPTIANLAQVHHCNKKAFATYRAYQTNNRRTR